MQLLQIVFHLVFLIYLCNCYAYFVFICCFIPFKFVFRNPSLHYGLSAAALFCSRNRTAIHLRNSLRLHTEKV